MGLEVPDDPLEIAARNVEKAIERYAAATVNLPWADDKSRTESLLLLTISDAVEYPNPDKLAPALTEFENAHNEPPLDRFRESADEVCRHAREWLRLKQS